MKLKTLCSAAALAIGFAGSAYATTSYPPFTVDQPGGAPTITGNQFAFGYKTQITVTGATTFSETGGVQFNAIQDNNTAEVSGSAVGNGFGDTYEIVGNLTATGDELAAGTTKLGALEATGNFTNLNLTLYLVPEADVGSLSQNANGTWTGVTAGELLATASLNNSTTSNAQLIDCASGSNTCGSWTLNTLLSQGAQFSGYFVAPAPFYVELSSGGNNEATITLPVPLNVGDVIADNGTGDAYFAVPEPASLTLFGGGLLWAGLAARRRKKKPA